MIGWSWLRDPNLQSSDDPATRMGIGLSLGQTASGNLLIGGSREFIGYDSRATAEVIGAMLRHALRIMPVLAGVRVLRTMAGLRPYTPDSMPIIGADPERPGLFIRPDPPAEGLPGAGAALRRHPRRY